MDVTVANLLLDIFGGNPYHALAKINKATGNVWYDPIMKPLSAKLLSFHLQGRMALGSYPLTKGEDTVKWVAWDIDAAGDINKARDMTKELIKQLENVPFVVEFSGGKGYHIFLFLDEPIPASLAKSVAENIRDQANLPKSENVKEKWHVEAFPKQDKLGKSKDNRKALGNCIKIPLGQHPRTHAWSVFVDPDNGWEDGPAIRPEEVLQYRISKEELESLQSEESSDRVDQLINVLAGEWSEGKRHLLCLYLSGYMASMGWSIDLASQVIGLIAKKANDPEPEDRQRSVEDTFRKAIDGQPVVGFSRLGEILPGSIMAFITRIIPEMAEPSMVRSVEKIRFGKGEAWFKAQNVIKLLWSDLQERGKFLIQEVENEAYFFNNETHLLIRVGSDAWDTFLYHDYHINMAENFYRQVTEGLGRMAMGEGKPTELKRRTAWDGQKLYLNLGGSEVYIIDGKEITIDFNGDCGFIFITSDVSNPPPLLTFDHPQVSCWDFLINDINFTESERAPISPGQQKELLKAWIISTFFRELLPTRPILALLGESGSGKTTAARRILRILEGNQEDVIQALQDKPDFWRASIGSHHVVVLDNLEKSGARWMVDSLNLVATGAHIELRRLYKTNEMYKIRPDCFVCITSVQMPFPDETLISRLLVLDLQKLTSFIPEHDFRFKISKYGAAIWEDLIYCLNDIVKTLKANQQVKLLTPMRLADFAIFCKRIMACSVIDAPLLEGGLKALGSSQMQALARAEHNIIPIMEEWFRTKPKEAADQHSISEIYSILQPIAMARKHTWRWSTSQALWGHIAALKEFLVSQYGAQFQKRYNKMQGKEENVISFPHLREDNEDGKEIKENGNHRDAGGQKETAKNRPNSRHAKADR